MTHPVAGDLVYQGDRIETGADGLVALLFVDGTTFDLHADTRVALDEFVYGGASVPNSARLRVAKGRFGFIAGQMARVGRLIVDTPLSLIKSRPSPAGVGSLALLFVLGLISEAEAGSEDISIVDDGTLTYKDLEHGVFEIITKGADPQVIVVDDPATTIVLRPRGSGVSIDQTSNTPTRMEDLQTAYRNAFVTFSQGQQDLFTQLLQRTASNGSTITTSTGLPPFLTSLGQLPDNTPFNPYHPLNTLPTGSNNGGGGAPHVNPTTLAATVTVRPVSNDQHAPVDLSPFISVSYTPLPSQQFVSITIIGLPPGESITDGNGHVYTGNSITISAADYLSGLTLTTLSGSAAVSGALTIYATMNGLGGLQDSLPAVLLLTVDQNGAIHWINSSGGDWQTGSNWSGGAVPIPFQDVAIDAPGTYVITSSANVSIDSLSVRSGATLQITGGTFAITSADDHPLSNAGIISVGSGASLDIGAAGFPGVVANTGTLRANGGTVDLIDITVNNAGGTIQVDAAAGSTLDLEAAIVNGGILTNAGTVNATGTSAIHGTAVTNSGLFEATAGTLTIDTASTIANTGTLQASGGELDITGSSLTSNHLLLATGNSILKLNATTVANSGGTVQVDHGSTLDLIGATVTGGSLANAGTVDSSGASVLTGTAVTNSATDLIKVSAGTLLIDGGSLANAGTLEASTGTLDLSNLTVTDYVGADTGTIQVDLNAILNLSNTTIAGGLLTGPGTITTVGANTVSLDGGSGHALTIDNNTTVTIATGTTLNLAGVIDGGGKFLVAGASTVHADGTVSVPLDAGPLANDTILTLSGTAALTVTHLIGDLDAHQLDGPLTVTTDDNTVDQTISITTGTGLTSIDATALTDGHSLTLAGNSVATVTLSAGDLLAGSYHGALTVIGGNGDNAITTGDAANVISGGTGNDTITGGLGNDTIYGGYVTADVGTTDKAVFAGNLAASAITFDPFAVAGPAGIDATVTGANGTDALHGIEIVQFADATIDLTKAVLLFDSSNHLVGSFDHIQDAVNAADNSGETIKIRDGHYAENVTIGSGKDGLTLVGQSVAGVVIEGTFKSDNGIAGGQVASWLQTHASYNGAAGNGVTIGSDGVTLQGLTLDGFTNAVRFLDGTTVDGTALTNLKITDSIIGVEKSATANVTNFTMTGGSISDGYIGLDIVKDATDPATAGVGIFDQVTIDGVSFTNLDLKGIYAEALSNAHLTNITMNNVGQFGSVPSFGSTGRSGNGIDLNLKNGAYSNVEIDHFHLTDTGLSTGGVPGATGQANGGAIVVEARDQGSYAGTPGLFSGAISIHDGIIDGVTSTGIQAGEPGQSNAGPATQIVNVAISGEQHVAHGDVANVTGSTMTVTLRDGGDSLFASPTTTGTLVVNGGTGDDSITTGSGNDTVNGGTGNDTITTGLGLDTAVYTATITAAQVTDDRAGHFIVATGGSEGTDTLSGIEQIRGAGTAHILLVGNGGYATIQAAINAAAAGDTIEIAAGTYNENLTIDKALTFAGANHGVAGTAGRGTESVLSWASGNAVTVTTTAAVVFDGLKFDGKNVTNFSTPATNVTFTNSVFDLDAGGNGGNNFYSNQPASLTFTDNLVDVTGYTGAFFQPIGASGHAADSVVTITGNTFNGHAGTYVPGDDNDVPVIANLSDVTGSVSDNTFNNVDIGVLVANGTGPLEITCNTFENLHRDGPATGNGNAAGVVFFTPAPFSATIDVSGNTFDNSDAGVRTSGVPGSTVANSPITIDDNDFTTVTHPGLQPDVGGVLHLTNSTVDGNPVPSQFLGGVNNDIITSTAVNDLIDGGNGIDTVVYAGATSADFSIVGGNWVVDHSGGSLGTDTLTTVEKVSDGAGHTFLLVGDGGYATIQAAVSAASSGDTILIAGGSYHENVTIGTAGLTLIGEAGAVIQGSFKTDNGIANGQVEAFLEAGNPYSQGAGIGVAISADNVTLKNVTIDGFTYGVGLSDGTDGATVSNVAFNDNLVGIHKGTTATISDFQLLGGTITDGLIGVEFYKDLGSSNGTADQIVIDGTGFSHLAYKGAYFEALSNAHLTNITMNDVGQFGAPSTSGTAGSSGNGIDLNLKNGVYSNVEIDHFHLTDTGSSDRNGADAVGHKNGGAIVVEARDQGSYAGTPGSFTGVIDIHDGIIDGDTSTGIQAGEPNQTNAGPATQITNVTITGEEQNALHGDVANVTGSTMTVTLRDGGDSLFASPTTTGTLVVNGGTGNDTITTGAGNDTINGGNGNDTLTSGAGTDTFVFNAGFGHDVISDFAQSTDSINFDSALFSPSSSISDIADLLNNHTADVSGHAVITFDAANTVAVQGLTTAQLQAHQADFHIV